MAQPAPPDMGSTIEVTLTSLDQRSPGVGPKPGDERPRPNWRRVVGVASIAGAAMGVLAGVILLDAGDDSAEEQTSTTPPGTNATSAITTPPTLAPLSELPPPDFTTRATLSTAPQGTTSQTRDLFNQEPRPPRYPVVTDLPAGVADRFALEPAVLGLWDDNSRRGTTRLEIGAGGFILDTRITYDATNERFELVVLSNAVMERMTVDVAGGWTYLDESRDEWMRIDNDELARTIGLPDMRTFVEQFLFGPIRPDTIEAAVSIEEGPFVELDNGLLAREHLVTMLAGDVPEWAEYLLGPLGDAPPVPSDQEIEYSVFVTADGGVRRVVATWRRGTTRQLVVHDLVRLSNPVTVTLPPVESVDDLDLPAADPTAP